MAPMLVSGISFNVKVTDQSTSSILLDENVVFDRSDDTAFKNARNQIQTITFENL